MLLSPPLKTITMEKEIDYLEADESCKEAMNELMINANKEKWLRKYCKLFKKISICPTGLANIANANFDGINYISIRVFHNEYQLVHLELSN
jgi:hypothetical protein